jgi:benzoyl-CoA-dihydrodiol lyase
MGAPDAFGLWPFSTHPSRYRHWKLTIDGDIARLALAVREDEPYRGAWQLKLNSYDLGVDLELADAVDRLRFEHPEVKAVVVTSERDRVFCAGANIHMLAASSHPFKVNFCKVTNETRLAIEDASRGSGQRYLAAVNGACAGGGYELALACDEILLIDDGSSTVSLPEVPLLGVLPGTGGLTRLVDKRKVRRDQADVFCTLAEGMKGKRAVDWRLVDAVAPRSRFGDAVAARARKLAEAAPAKVAAPVVLDDVTPQIQGDALVYRHVTLAFDRARRIAELTVRAPDAPPPADVAAIVKEGAAFWPLRAFRELDDALLRLRFQLEEIGLVTVKTRGAAAHVLAADAALLAHADHGFVREVRLLVARVLRRLDATARSFFAVMDEGSCFVGTLLELALACDRAYMLEAEGVTVQASPLLAGHLPTGQGLSRLALRYLATPARLEEALERASAGPVGAEEAAELALVTVTADDIDFADELRVAVEERLSLSPDALTGLEASLRFAGPETVDTKIFGRLSAWQNWIFIRPNATGERGALTMYGKPERPVFDPRRT